ncbi:MAG: hypothetical protein R3C14_25500 [Caldilineaceae bacterium]
MLTIGGLLVTGGTVYAAHRLVKARHLRLRLPWPKRRTHAAQIETYNSEAAPDTLYAKRALGVANRAVALSSASLGLAAAGVVFHPVLIVVSVPITLYIFIPTFQSAYHSLRQERRVTTPVLDATRITVCIVMGYYWAAALNAWLQSLSQKVLTQSEVDFKRALQQYAGAADESVWLFTQGADVATARRQLTVGDVVAVDAEHVVMATGVVLYGSALVDERLVTGEIEPVRKEVGDLLYAATRLLSGSLYLQITEMPVQLTTDVVRGALQKTVEGKLYTQQWGEHSGQHAAPRMLALFALLLPFWDANRAAGFLTTSFGAQMRTLSPFTLQNFVALAAQQEILIKDGRALERVNLVNAILLDAASLTDKAAIEQAKDVIYALRRRFWPMQRLAPYPFAIYLVATDEAVGRALAAELGCDDYFVAPQLYGRVALVERLQASGRSVCYVGDGITQAPVMDKAVVGISIAGAATVAQDAAQIVLVTQDLAPLAQVFELGAQFITKQGFNLAWPLLMDVVDISTTVFWHLGLVYSLCFSYSGLLLSALNARAPLRRYQRTQWAQESQPDNQHALVPAR